MTVGALAHLFGKLPYKELAERIGSKKIEHVQLAIWKALNDEDFTQVGKLNPGLVRRIKKEFDKHQVSISVLACYLHLFDRNIEKRQENLARFKELLRYAPLFGAPIVAVEVGKMPIQEVTDQDWETLKSSLSELIYEAQKWGVTIGIEPANDHLIGSAKSLKRMLDELPSTHLGVVLDPGNLLTADNFHKQDEVIQEAFDLLGERIVACHAKDRMIDEHGEIQTVTPGTGQMNYDLYLSLLQSYKPQCDIIMEHTPPNKMSEVKSFIEGKRIETIKRAARA
ncbi:sugar phosphate isomerase/epimerase family protein [Halalkalibacter krulwichiae]|uniref:Xylose isomerase-like TIM barrel n=1 Tax=Halalkalibacter krulwichiae TaxID=199441 RepID=A0A1X9MA57_9BACI|nr:sugar phosphate isomerase/epimerase [Halalkalibacter krulwichiae]ARK29534.1 Xylose isomerase-like TIM barrel [Halalkalibacter krulwichiae]